MSLCVCVCVCVSLSHAGIVSKRLNWFNWFLTQTLRSSDYIMCCVKSGFGYLQKQAYFPHGTFPPNSGLERNFHRDATVSSCCWQHLASTFGWVTDTVACWSHSSSSSVCIAHWAIGRRIWNFHLKLQQLQYHWVVYLSFPLPEKCLIFHPKWWFGEMWRRFRASCSH